MLSCNDRVLGHCISSRDLQLGFIGLVEEDWLATLSTVDVDDVTFTDCVEEGRSLAKQLKANVNENVSFSHEPF